MYTVRLQLYSTKVIYCDSKRTQHWYHVSSLPDCTGTHNHDMLINSPSLDDPSTWLLIQAYIWAGYTSQFWWQSGYPHPPCIWDASCLQIIWTGLDKKIRSPPFPACNNLQHHAIWQAAPKPHLGITFQTHHLLALHTLALDRCCLTISLVLTLDKQHHVIMSDKLNVISSIWKQKRLLTPLLLSKSGKNILYKTTH